jgi:hypothetical protein
MKLEKLHNKKIRKLYSSVLIIRVIMDGTCSTHVAYDKCIPLGTYWLRGAYTNKMRHKEIRVCVCGLDSLGSGQGPVAVSCEHRSERSGSKW